MNVFKLQDIHFLRCLKPSHQKLPNNFDNAYVMNQLKCSSVIPYAQCVRFGYPKHIAISDFNKKFNPHMMEYGDSFKDTRKLYKLLLNTIGYKTSEFKFGQIQYFSD